MRKYGVDESKLGDANYPFNMDQQKWNDANEKCREEYLSSMILMQANRERFA